MKPIIFSTPMVQAILDGRKTQTRRIAKFLGNRNPNWTGYIKDGLQLYNGRNEPCLKEPQYKVGDVLWVRETFNGPHYQNGYKNPSFLYRADLGENIVLGGKWKPSIHMPREAARIFLKVTNVRVERLQEITAEDVIREGIKYSDSGPYHWHVLDTKLNAWINFHFHDEAFKHLWDSLNAKRGYGWDTNPWVWVVAFEKISKEKAFWPEEVMKVGLFYG